MQTMIKRIKTRPCFRSVDRLKAQAATLRREEVGTWLMNAQTEGNEFMRGSLLLSRQ